MSMKMKIPIFKRFDKNRLKQPQQLESFLILKSKLGNDLSYLICDMILFVNPRVIQVYRDYWSSYDHDVLGKIDNHKKDSVEDVLKHVHEYICKEVLSSDNGDIYDSRGYMYKDWVTYTGITMNYQFCLVYDSANYGWCETMVYTNYEEQKGYFTKVKFQKKDIIVDPHLKMICNPKDHENIFQMCKKVIKECLEISLYTEFPRHSWCIEFEEKK